MSLGERENQVQHFFMKECWMARNYKHIALDERTLIQTQLQQGFKPGAIAVSLNEPVRLCHETIYQAIYAMPKGELRTETIAL